MPKELKPKKTAPNRRTKRVVKRVVVPLMLGGGLVWNDTVVVTKHAIEHTTDDASVFSETAGSESIAEEMQKFDDAADAAVTRHVGGVSQFVEFEDMVAEILNETAVAVAVSDK